MLNHIYVQKHEVWDCWNTRNWVCCDWMNAAEQRNTLVDTGLGPCAAHKCFFIVTLWNFNFFFPMLENKFWKKRNDAGRWLNVNAEESVLVSVHIYWSLNSRACEAGLISHWSRSDNLMVRRESSLTGVKFRWWWWGGVPRRCGGGEASGFRQAGAGTWQHVKDESSGPAGTLPHCAASSGVWDQDFVVHRPGTVLSRQHRI